MAHKHPFTFHTNAILTWNDFYIMHEMRLLMPTTRVPTDSSTHATPSVKTQSLVFHPMTQLIGPTSNIHLNIIKFRVFIYGLRHFPGSHRRIGIRLPTFLWAFTTGDHVQSHVNLGLSPWGEIYPNLLRPTHVYIFFSFSIHTTVSLNVDVVHLELTAHSPRMVNRP